MLWRLAPLQGLDQDAFDPPHVDEVRVQGPRVNEALAKVLCHNIVVLIHSIYELGIEPVLGNPENTGTESTSVPVSAQE